MVGTYIIEYNYTDTAGNTGTTVTRTVNVVDTTAPVVTVNGATGVTIERLSSYIESGASWIDAIDGTGSIPAPTSGSVNTGVVGVYVLEYSYTDAQGNTGTAIRTVTVVDTTAPLTPVITVPTTGQILATGNVTVSGTGEVGGIVSIYS